MRLRHDPKVIRHVTDAKDFGRVAVLFGGTSSEREISLKSGQACLAALLKRGVDAHGFDPREKPLAELVQRKFDRVFIALHGPGGDDGTLQGALEFLGLPYTGSGVMGSAIGMDKLRTKRLAQAVGIPTTDYMVLRSPADLDNCIERLAMVFSACPHVSFAHLWLFLGKHQIHPLADILFEVDVLDVHFAHANIHEPAEQLVQQIWPLGEMRQ